LGYVYFLMTIRANKRSFVVAVAVLLAVPALVWLATTDNSAVWPVRNILQYRLLTWWWERTAQAAEELPGTLEGTVSDIRGKPIEGAWVLLARRDGTTYRDRSDAAGQYHIAGLPPGTYRPVAGAPGYDSVQFGDGAARVQIRAGTATEADVRLPAEPVRTVMAGHDFSLGEPSTGSCESPLASNAIRRQIHFQSDHQPNQPAFYYTPLTTTTTSRWPLLLAIYPGPADTWECASLPLAEAGYAVLATGPAYSFDLEADIDELARLLDFVRAGQFPGADGDRIAILGGSYSSLHVQRLLQRREPVRAAMLLGPPTDLFDMRRRLENGSYIPPFGLDQALIALGFPDRVPLRYWRYSGAYHVRSDFPPLAILHSRSDQVVPYQQSELLIEHLSQVGATYEVHFFDGGSHYLLAEESDAQDIYRISLAFLEKYLQ
jgi:dipeptidyl aminopeptidase/acylaminoacyl peptidase